MEVKLIEIRDRATLIPAMAIKFEPRTDEERFLWRYSGFASDMRYIILIGIQGGHGKMTCDPYEWNDRTRLTAHKYIVDNWDDIQSCDVIDVEVILGEKTTPSDPLIRENNTLGYSDRRTNK